MTSSTRPAAGPAVSSPTPPAGPPVSSPTPPAGPPVSSPTPPAGPPVSSPAPPAGPPAPVPLDRKPWESELHERRVAVSVRMPRSLKSRLDGLADHLALTDPADLPDSLGEVANQTEVFNMGLHLFLAAAEAELNAGRPLPLRIRRR